MITPLKDLRLFPGADVDNWSDIKFTAAAYLMIAAFGTVMLAALWLGKKSLRGRWLPIQRVRYIPWHGIDVILVFMITQTIPPLVFQALLQAGFFEWLYGVAADKAMREREICWSGLVAYPLTLGLIILGLRQFRMARISEMGLTAVRAAKNFAVGLAGWAILTPTALLILALAIVATPQEWHSWVEEHPVSRLTQQTVTPVDWVVVFLAVVILAPLLEELVFRGIILPWQLRAGWEGQATVALCALLVAAVGGDRETGTAYNPLPVVFVLAMLPGVFMAPFLRYFFGKATSEVVPPPDDSVDESAAQRLEAKVASLLRATPMERCQPGVAIFANGLFFAAMHSAVWPSPVPLLVLGVGLAWITYRTSSLVGAVTIHALFNAVAALSLMAEYYWR